MGKHYDYRVDEHALVPVIAAALGSDADAFAEKVAREVAYQVMLGVVFDFDPEVEEPRVDDVEQIRMAVARVFDGEFVDHTDALVAAFVAAVDDGRVEVDTEEPYDSCRACGGYHNVNYDCS